MSRTEVLQLRAHTMLTFMAEDLKPFILAALLEDVETLRVRIYDNPAQPYHLSPEGDAATGFARLKEWEKYELLLFPVPEEAE